MNLACPVSKFLIYLKKSTISSSNWPETYVVMAVTGPGDTAEDLTQLVGALRKTKPGLLWQKTAFPPPADRLLCPAASRGRAP